MARNTPFRPSRCIINNVVGWAREEGIDNFRPGENSASEASQEASEIRRGRGALESARNVHPSRRGFNYDKNKKYIYFCTHARTQLYESRRNGKSERSFRFRRYIRGIYLRPRAIAARRSRFVSQRRCYASRGDNRARTVHGRSVAQTTGASSSRPESYSTVIKPCQRRDEEGPAAATAAAPVYTRPLPFPLSLERTTSVSGIGQHALSRPRANAILPSPTANGSPSCYISRAIFRRICSPYVVGRPSTNSARIGVCSRARIFYRGYNR